MTKYVILEQGDDGWHVTGEEESVTAKAAVAKHVNGRATGDEFSGSFVAVPARSWKPVKVGTKTALTFS